MDRQATSPVQFGKDRIGERMTSERPSTRRAVWPLVGCVIVCVMLVALPFACSYWVMESLPVSERALERVRPGMSKDSVREILGAPSSVGKGKTQEVWTYSGWCWAHVYVYFAEGTVTDTEIDK